jgi:hypothetical protein
MDGGVVRRLRRGLKRAFSEAPARRGQALVEFALVVPVMVTLVLFAIYFYEINHVRLKAQEMARYAAWEFTGYPLHDYADTDPSGQFSSAQSSVQQDVQRRYANLESTNRGGGSRYLAVSWRDPRIRIRNKMEPKIPEGRELGLPINLNTVFNIVGLLVDLLSIMQFEDPNAFLVAMVAGYKVEESNMFKFGARVSRFNPPRRWGFNTKGYIWATARISYRNEFIPRRFMEGVRGWFSNRHYSTRDHVFEETTAVVADSWRLHYGDDITHSNGEGKPYYKQIERMMWVSNVPKGVVQGISVFTQTLTALICGFSAVSGYIGFPPTMDPMKPALVSKAYKGRRPLSGQVRLSEDKGHQNYDTSPNRENSEYREAFTQRGEHFMGCTEPESLGCGPSLSTDNPFGDYVVPPPEE